MILRLITAFGLSAVALVLWASAMHTTSAPEDATTQTQQETHTVTRIIDGDTVEIETGELVRYIGMDAPEISRSIEAETECYADESRVRNAQLVLNKTVRLERDTSETDTYGRLLRYVYIYDPLSSIHPSTSVNEILVREGYAVARAYPPDTKKHSLLVEAQQLAQSTSLGLWRSCK